MERVKIKIKKNDIVKIIAGASKGKEGKVIGKKTKQQSNRANREQSTGNRVQRTEN